MDKKFNVYIFDNGGEAMSMIGESLTEERAESRELSGLSRIDRENYFVAKIEAGSEDDKRAREDLINNK